MFLKETKALLFVSPVKRGLASGTDRRSPRNRGHRTLLVTLVVLTIIAAISAFQLLPYVSNSGIVQHWKLTLTFHNSRTNQNLTLPIDIGVQGGIWMNHTLDFLGRPGYAPISTRDNSDTIYVETNRLAVLTFGDFFNIWGEPFNGTCAWFYCAAPAELVVNDTDGSNLYNTGDLVLNSVNGSRPALGANLSTDQNIKFVDTDRNGVWDSGEPVVYDANSNSTYASNDPTIYVGVTSPARGDPLTFDPKLRFVDTNSNGGPNRVWDDTVPPPVMSDNGSNEGCVRRQYGLSNSKDWIVALYSPRLAALFGCKP
jgi:hypothetical protein